MSLTPLPIKTQGIGKQWWAQMGNENQAISEVRDAWEAFPHFHFNEFMHGFIINKKKIAPSQKSHSVGQSLHNLLVCQAEVEAV